MSTRTRALALMLITMWAGCTRAADPVSTAALGPDVGPIDAIDAAATTPAADTSASVADVALVTADAVSPAADASADAVPANSEGLMLHITAESPLSGLAKVKLVPGTGPLGPSEAPGSFNCYVGNLTTPQDIGCLPPDGVWRVQVVLMKGTTFAGWGSVCDGDVPLAITVKQGIATPDEVSVPMQAAGTGGNSPCGEPTKGGAQGYLQVLDTLQPTTAKGPTTLVASLPAGERLWVAAGADGLGSFDFPAVPPIPPPKLANWTQHGTGPCARLARVGATIICSDGGPLLRLRTFAGPAAGASSEFDLGSGIHAWGMATTGTQLFVAAHDAGLRILEPQPTGAGKPTQVVGLTDAWDVAVQDPYHLLVADGESGLRTVDVKTGQVLATLPLPGRAAFVAVQGALAVVGSLGGGVHVVDAGDFMAPKLRTTWAFAPDGLGVAVLDGRLFAAIGSHVLSADVPPNGAPLMRAALPGPRWTVDVDPLAGNTLAASEVAGLRRLGLDTKVSSGPLLLAPSAVAMANVALGGQLRARIRLTSAGNVPVHLQSIQFMEGKGVPVQNLTVPKPMSQGASAVVVLDVPKTLANVTHHELVITSDDIAQPSMTVALDEVAAPAVGAPLPMVAAQDAAGQAKDVLATLAGKPAVVLLASESDPVSLLALASAATTLAPPIAKGQVAAVALDPVGSPSSPQAGTLKLPFPLWFSPAALPALGLPSPVGTPLPVTLVLDAAGKVRWAQWGWDAAMVTSVLAEVGP